MSKPLVERHGDEWVLVWNEAGIGMGVERLRDSHDGIHGEVTFESRAPDANGRLHGPVRLNLLSSESQTRLANVLTKRHNHVDWPGMITQACAIVAKQFREGPSASDLSEGDDPGPVEYLVPGFLPLDETTILYGDGASAKSLTALAVALCCTDGMALPWGVEPKRLVGVLVLDYETTERTYKSRMRRLARGMELERIPPVFHRTCLRPLPEDVGAITKELYRLKNTYGPDDWLVVVDSLSFAVRGSLNEDQVARDVVNAMRELPATRLAVAHVSRESATRPDGRADPFGSIFFRNGMRYGWELRRAEESPIGSIDVGMFFQKGNDDEPQKPIGLRYVFEAGTGIIRLMQQDVHDIPDLAVRTKLSERIRNALKKANKSLDTNAIAHLAGSDAEAVAKALKRMPDVVQLYPGGGRGNAAVWGLSG